MRDRRWAQEYLGLVVAGLLLGCGSAEPQEQQTTEVAWSLETLLGSAEIRIDTPGSKPARKGKPGRQVRYRLGRLDEDRRPSIVQRASGSITFTGLQLRQRPQMRFSIAFPTWEEAGDTADFSITVISGGRQERVYQRHLEPAIHEADRGWLQQDLSLQAFADQTVDVVLRAELPSPTQTTVHSVYWGEPEIVAESTSSGHLPNVVLVSFDTLRADYLGTYGYPDGASPVIDGVASSGVVFEQCVSQSSWTRPGHFSMLASRYPGPSLLQYNEKHCKVPSDVVTLAELLKEHDYLTAAFTGGGYVGLNSGFEQGFDYFRSYGRRFETSLQPALEWLESHAKSRFFLFLHNYNVHTPYQPPKDALDRFVPSPPEACEGVTFSSMDSRAGRVAKCRQQPGGPAYQKGTYAAEVFHVDRLFGEVMAQLQRLGIDENTILILTSDHGEGLFDHGEAGHITNVHQELIQVPLIFAGPGVPSGVRVEDTVQVLDLAPTLLDLLGLPAPAGFQGRSLAPLLQGSELAPREAFAASSWGQTVDFSKRFPHTLTAAVVRDGKKKIRNLGTSVDEIELYDLRQDPRELKSLKDRDVAWGRDLDQALTPWLRGLSQQSDCEQTAMDPDKAEELRALGYLQ